ncbi:hypothetical protein IJS77_03260 [bacterium]|nr:hypothetical protein [bacterium]
MVLKIKYIKLIILTAVFFLLCFLSFSTVKKAEGNLLKTLLPNSVVKSENIIPLSEKTASVIKVVFESDDEVALQELKSNFLNNIDKNYFEINSPDLSMLADNYIKHPENFLSFKTRQLLKAKKYDEVYSNALNELYNPSVIQLTTTDKDPYFLFNDFIFSNLKMPDSVDNIDDKYYDYTSLKIKNGEGLSPDFSNNKIAELVASQKKLSVDNSEIYLSGSPIHSYYTSQRAKLSINIICILSTLLVIFLTYFYFKNLKPLLPVLVSLSIGMLTGFVAVNLFFESFQLITMVFSTTLIGIGIDYSYHYFFAEKIDKTFIKNLTLSLLTTIIPFILLYFTGIELLKQVAVFTIFGLSAIYIAVLIFYPCFEVSVSKNTIKPSYKYCKIVFYSLCLLSFLGIFRFNFSDSLSTLYTPTKKLLNAETLYNKVSGEEFKNTQFVITAGLNFENVIKEEEKITDILTQNNIDFMSLSKFLPSKERQRENFDLVKDLYSKNLDKFSDILTSEQIQNLKNTKFEPVLFNKNLYPYLNSFLLAENKSVIFVFSNKIPQLNEVPVQVINIKSDTEKYIKEYRQKLILLFPIVLIVLIGFLSVIYGLKQAVKLLLPPFTGVIFALFINNLIFGEINLFGIINLFLILGFTMDYSIFRNSGNKNCEDAILTSSLTTSVSFLLLTLSGFKLLSSMAVILFFGITISYLVGYLIFNKDKSYIQD